MTPSTALQTPLERPSIDLPGGVKVFASRDGDRITGHVLFPYVVHDRVSVPIDYRNAPLNPSNSSKPSTADAKALARQAMVLRWRSLCDADKSITRLEHAKRVCDEFRGSGVSAFRRFSVSVRSLQLWARKLDTEGPDALSDRYEPMPRKILSLESKLAADAVSICAWWAFRIGNEKVIDSKMVHSAAAIRPRAEYMRDILGAIDVYYAWPTDRAKMPFKPFARWAKYDFDKWLYRALTAAAAQSEPGAQATGHVSLQQALTVIPRDDSVPGVKTRQREVRHHGTRRAIAALASSTAAPGCDTPSSSMPNASMPQCLSSLPDHHRWMLIRAARGDADARNQAVVTMPIWWDKLPEQLRLTIDARADAWKREHPSATGYAIASRKLAMLGPSIRKPKSGPKLACELLETLV